MDATSCIASLCEPCEAALALLTLAGRRWVWGEARLLGLRGGEHGLTRHCAGSRVGSLLICMPCVVVHRDATVSTYTLCASLHL